MSPLSTYVLVSLILLLAGFILGIITQRKWSKVPIANLHAEMAKLKTGLFQLQSDYDILLQAMHGAKMQAENYQRQLLGSNIMEIQRHEDPEKLLNRKLLADYIYKKLEDNYSKSDLADDEQIPGDPRIIESLEVLDDRVVDILTNAIK